MQSNSQEAPLPMKQEEEQNPHEELIKGKKPHRLGWITIFVIFGILGVWAVVAKIETSVQASGKVISKGYKKMIQHPRGGMVTKLYVHEGDKVRKGDPILALDNVSVLSKLQSAISQHDELITQKARLEAESNLNEKANFDTIRNSIIDSNRTDELIQKEKALFQSNVEKLHLKIQLLHDKNRILQQQNEGLKEQEESAKRQLASYQKELKKWQSLYERNMTDELKLLERKRKIEEIKARIAQTESKIKENEVTMKANENQMRLERTNFVNEARKRLKETQLKLENLRETIASLRNAKKRLLITSPDSGTIVNMTIHSAGEVVIPNKPIAYVVPDSNKLILEMMIKPTDIDKVHKGQECDIKFPSYVDPGAKPIEGNLTYVSADTIVPPGSKKSFYKAIVEITPKGMRAIKENGFEIVPGMPASAYIKAGKRSFLGYILTPLESLGRGAFHAN